jgi:hypothetical protein
MSPRIISQEALPHFENMIYLPILVTILSRDKEIIEKSQIKLKKPYLAMIERSLDNVQKDLRNTHEYLHQYKMKFEKGRTDGNFTDFHFFHQGYEDKRQYLNVRLRNRSEELLSGYLNKNSLL